MSLQKNQIKQIRDNIKSVVEDLELNYKTLEASLTEKDLDASYYFHEFHRHGREFIELLTDERIEEKFK